MPHDDAALCSERPDQRLLEDGRERLDERVAAIGERVPVREIESLEVEQLVDDSRGRPTGHDGSVNGLGIGDGIGRALDQDDRIERHKSRRDATVEHALRRDLERSLVLHDGPEPAGHVAGGRRADDRQAGHAGEQPATSRRPSQAGGAGRARSGGGAAAPSPAASPRAASAPAARPSPRRQRSQRPTRRRRRSRRGRRTRAGLRTCRPSPSRSRASPGRWRRTRSRGSARSPSRGASA